MKIGSHAPCTNFVSVDEKNARSTMPNIPNTVITTQSFHFHCWSATIVTRNVEITNTPVTARP